MENNINPANQPMQQATFFAFDSPKGQSAYIKVIGVGGGGGNAVNHMYREGIHGVDFIVCNTDMKALNASPVPNKIPLGDLGLGAGNKPERARQAALDKADDIREALSHNTQMLFITAGMGGGTGTGAAPVIAEIAKSIELNNEDTKKILVVAIVTLPFGTEGKKRREQAEAGIVELSKHVDSILVINNDKLLSFKDFTLSRAFGMANDVLLTAAKGIAEIITVDAYVNIDFQDVNTVMENSGTALMGAGSGKGENRAIDAIKAATTSVLLNDNDIRGAKNVLIYYSYSSEHEITMEELGNINDYLADKTDGTADVIWGAGADDSLDDELKVTLIATGFEKSNFVRPEPTVYELPEDKPSEQPVQEPVASQTDAPVDIDRMEIIHRESPQPKAEAEAVANDAMADVAKHAGRVFVLDEDTLEFQQPAQPAVEMPVAKVDSLVEDIHIVVSGSEPRYEEASPAAVAAPIQEPARTPVSETPARSAFENMNDVKLTQDRAKRIAYINSLLHSNPNGVDMVHGMSTQQIMGEELYEGNASSEREASSYVVRQNGSMGRNGWLDGQPD
ncbi:MAG: cell division protein FtsZ [Bacteroidales bacterium]|nr:cell division protein FtsZ [Bacteroidales bacterium]